MSAIPKRKSGSVDIAVRRWNAELQLYEDSINAVLHSDQANGDQCRSIQPLPQKLSLIRNPNIPDLFRLNCICFGEAGLKPGGFEAGPRLPCRSITHCAPWDADARARKDPEAGPLPQGPGRRQWPQRKIRLRRRQPACCCSPDRARPCIDMRGARPDAAATRPCIDFAGAHRHIGGAASAAVMARLRGLRDGSGAFRRDPAPLFITCMHPGRPITRAAPCQRIGSQTISLAVSRRARPVLLHRIHP
jgi:hypothetical protein